MKMQFFTIAALISFLAGAAQAAPSAQPRQFQAQITFVGDAGAEFSLSVPTDGSVFSITNLLSISHITSLSGATCAFVGADGSQTVVVGAQTVDVGPPQTQISGSCLAF